MIWPWIAAVLGLAALVCLCIWLVRTFSPVRAAGRRGERQAAELLSEEMRDGDVLLSNVKIRTDGRRTELDHVIVNRYGVFIIEVKNYKGRLYGAEDDYYWEKDKEDPYGITHHSQEKNPIRQVNRQVYLLARHLDSCGAKAWVEGYALLIQHTSPVASDRILTSPADIDRVIHTPGRERLSTGKVEAICGVLSV